MLQLSTDSNFHFEILRNLSLATYQGADIGEVLTAAAQIEPGNFESWYKAFNSMANRVHEQAETIDTKKHPVSSRNARFKESSYYRSADFFLHGDWDDPRINSLWQKQRAAFDAAISLLPNTAERLTLHAGEEDGFSIPAIFYHCGKPGRRPTILMCNGFDGSQEELYHVMVEAALQRGMNAITFEGPGQPTVRREQELGFIPEWEKVVSPVVDYAMTCDDIDPDAIALMGFSMSGLLAVRAAAFEHRLAAVFAIDGVYDMGLFNLTIPDEATEKAIHEGDKTTVDGRMTHFLNSPTCPTGLRWLFTHGCWSFNTKSIFEWVEKMQEFTLKHVYQQVKTPVFVASAEEDIFFRGQPEMLCEKLGDLAVFHEFKTVDGAGAHCGEGAMVLQNQVILDWFEDLIAAKK